MNQYAKVLSHLYSISLFRNGRADLSSMAQMTSLLGNPQSSLEFVHVAGTNGKGTLTLKMQKLLQQLAPCGCYTSPHITSFRERIKINDDPIERSFVEEQLAFLFDLADKHKIALTFFEYITCLALLYFREKKVRYVAWETGLGGRLDATNIIPAPLLSIITSIGYDHQKVLGSTLPEIAFEKAGIIKPRRPVVLGPNAQPYEIFIKEAALNQSPIFIVKDRFTSFEDENNAIAAKAAEVLSQTQGFRFCDFEAMRTARQSCRLERVPRELVRRLTDKDIQIVMDVGHNVSAIVKSVDKKEKVLSEFDRARLVVVYGTSSQKDSAGSLKLLRGTKAVYLVESRHFRSKKIAQLTEEVSTEKVVENGNIKATIEEAVRQGEPGDTVLIVGSFYIMGEARRHLGYDDEFDPEELNWSK